MKLRNQALALGGLNYITIDEKDTPEKNNAMGMDFGGSAGSAKICLSAGSITNGRGRKLNTLQSSEIKEDRGPNLPRKGPERKGVMGVTERGRQRAAAMGVKDIEKENYPRNRRTPLI